MFKFFKKRCAVPSAEDLSRLTASAREDVKGKWVEFNKTIHLKAEIPLSQRIDLFAQPVQNLFQKQYPMLLLGSTEIFWLAVFTAILESGTHPKDQVNAAIAELRGKYTRSGSAQ